LTPTPDGGFAEVPRPTVITDFDAPGDSVTDVRRTGVFPAVGGNNDASPPPPRWDAAPDASADAPTACSILLQDCPLTTGGRRGCYLGADGVPLCLLAGDFPENAVCEDQQQCLPGLICVEVNGGSGTGSCQRACDPTVAGTCGVASCLRLAFVPIGYCSP
jgi:hypothetical protein